MPSDKDYKETKQIMLGKKKIRPEFKLLADWIDKTYGVKTVNIYYDTIDNGKRPRLEICFEHSKDEALFAGKNRFGFDANKQKAIGEKFKKILKDQEVKQERKLDKIDTSRYKTKNVWVVYGNFESVAKIEANESIPETAINALKSEFNNKDIWGISRAFSRVTIFLYTDDQVKKYENSEVHKEWTDKYYKLLIQYDEFGYFKREAFAVYLDSKENFDNNYKSNWYYYYK